MKKALSEEEWGLYRLRCAGKAVGGSIPGYGVVPDDTRPEKKHAIAAMLLDGQPFGFTHEMVEALTKCLDIAVDESGADSQTVLASLAIANIEALLPPKAP